MKLKILNEELKKLYGEEVEIEVDSDCIPKDVFWRRRLRDSKIDGCVEIINDKPKARKKGSK